MKKQLRTISVKGHITDDEFSSFQAEYIADGETQSSAIRNMIRNRTAHRNSTDRRSSFEGTNKPRIGPEHNFMFAVRCPGKVNYSGSMRKLV
jgi:hypothetical protein